MQTCFCSSCLSSFSVRSFSFCNDSRNFTSTAFFCCHWATFAATWWRRKASVRCCRLNKWPTFYRHYAIHFLKMTILVFSFKFHRGLIFRIQMTLLVQVMASCQTGNKPLAILTMTKFHNTIWWKWVNNMAADALAPWNTRPLVGMVLFTKYVEYCDPCILWKGLSTAIIISVSA